MKYFIVILAVCALVHAEDEWKAKSGDELKAVREECLKEQPLSEEYIEKLTTFEFPDEEPVRKHLLCSAKKLGIFTEAEGYNPERIAQQFNGGLDEAEVLAIAKGCSDKNEDGSSADVWAYRGHKCLVSSAVGDKMKAQVKEQLQKAE